MDDSLIRPIQQMSAQSRHIAGNDFDLPDLRMDSADEVGELIRAFNRAKHVTREHITTLEEKNRMASELHRRELEALEDYIYIQQTRYDGRITYKKDRG